MHKIGKREVFLLMSKKYLALLAVTVCVSLIPGFTLASPLMDYSAGKTSVDITSYPNLHMKDHVKSSSYSNTIKFDGKNNNIDWGIITGVGGKWALQYRQFNPDGVDNYKETIGMRTQEVNVLYKLDTNLSAFVGWHRSKMSYELTGVPFSPENKDVLQGGIIGTTKIAPKTQLYCIIGVGKKLSNFETGISYEVDKHIEMKLVYRYKKIGDMDSITSINPTQDEVTAHGYGVGVTYKF